MSLNTETNEMKAEHPSVKGGTMITMDKAWASFLDSAGVRVKASLLRDYDKIQGVKAKATKACFETMGESEAYENTVGAGNSGSFAGIYIWFSKTEAAANAMPGSLLPEGVTEKELISNYFKYAPYILYLGMSDNVFDRILAPGTGKADGHGVGKFMFHESLEKADLQVLVLTIVDVKTGKLLTGAKLKDFEASLHRWNEENIGARHLLHNYSGVKGEHGSDMSTVSAVIDKANEAKIDAILMKLFRRTMELQTGRIMDKIEDAVHEFDLDEEGDDA